MKKIFGILSACFILFGLISCSNLNESTSLSLKFNGSDFAQTSARNISVDSEYEGMYIVASILGDYTETKSLEISSNGTYTIEFASVPVGAKIYVEANVYNPNYTDDFPYCHTFTGTSEKQNIHSGENTINLSMKNITVNTGDGIWLHGNYNEQMGTYVFKGYSNGKYKVIYNSNPEQILSEGIWNEDYYKVTGFTAGTVIPFKECAYKTYAAAEVNGPQDVSNLIIVEQPVWKTFTVQGDVNEVYLEIGNTKVFE